MPGIYQDSSKTTVAKTASYNLHRDDNGKCFTNLGAGGAIVFTLPAITEVWDGWEVDFYVEADQTVTVTAPAGKLIAFNNAAATSLAFSTASEKIGGGMKVRFDGALYQTWVFLGIETQTPVVS